MVKNIYKILFVLSVQAILLTACNGVTQATESISQQDLMTMITSGDSPVILDVRTPREFEDGHVPGAINISHDELSGRLDELVQHKESAIVVYCRSGKRAGIAESILWMPGFSI